MNISRTRKDIDKTEYVLMVEVRFFHDRSSLTQNQFKTILSNMQEQLMSHNLIPGPFLRD